MVRLFAALAVAAALPVPAQAAVREATVSTGGSPVQPVRADHAFGAALDGHSQGDTALIYSHSNVTQMRASGLGPLSYRLRTELGVEAWHWSPTGSFSAGANGYWTSSSAGWGAPVSWGYRLPRRGNTSDQANDDSYSRLDDASRGTFWKSNPYLDELYTPRHERHPQWIVIDLGRRRAIDALQLDWAAPYATRFEVERWIGPSAIIQNGHPLGHWRRLVRSGGHGGRQTLRLAPRPIAVRFLRVLLERSSHTALPGSRDVRDRLGYAIREVGAGLIGRRGFVDFVRHRANGSQTPTYASSTDPWHRASDRDPNVEQPGFRTVLRSGLARGLPLMVPVSVLYGTPADAVAEIRAMVRHHVPLRGVELGEEPDGQLAAPEDYGALYLEFARALHRAFPHLTLGGPGFQTSIPDWLAWPDARGERSWTARFIAYLRSHRALSELGFFSFEWYPFDNPCRPAGAQLAHVQATLAAVVRAQLAHGLPSTVPLVITEYGYSAFAGEPEVDIAGALLNADTVGEFLALGGDTTYLYGYEPDGVQTELRGCRSYGNLTLLLSDERRRIRARLPTWYAARMLSEDWLGSQPNAVLPARVTFSDGGDPQLLGAYAVRRPAGDTALLLVNKDRDHAISVRLPFGGPYAVVQYSAGQYRWHPQGPAGRPLRDLAPQRSLQAGPPLSLPAFSLTVVRPAVAGRG